MELEAIAESTRYIRWAEGWGLQLAFAVTQSAERAESIVTETLFAAMTAGADASRFASIVWEISERQAFRGASSDAFFKMAPVGRGVVVLKTKARFSTGQIARALGITPTQVSDLLENARMIFSRGRTWLKTSPTISASISNWIPECPHWRKHDDAHRDIQHMFARYLGEDLDPESGATLHSHLVVCTTCRTNLTAFKQRYLEWTASIPAIALEQGSRRQLEKTARMALKMQGELAPSPWPGVRKMWESRRTRVVLAGLGALAFIYFLAS